MKQQVSIQMDSGLNAGQTVLTKFVDSVDVVPPMIYDKIIFQDVEDKLLVKRWTFDEYAHHVLTTLNSSYKGINKYLYGKVIDAVKTIVYAKTQHMRHSKIDAAIVFLHQDIKLSPVTIHRILLLFGVKISVCKILNVSQDAFMEKTIPTWLSTVMGEI
jgi:hypothetical protein